MAFLQNLCQQYGIYQYYQRICAATADRQFEKRRYVSRKQRKKTITLDNEVTGRYILIVITDGKGNNYGKHATCAELTVNKYVDASQVVNVTYTYQLSGTQTTKTKTVKQIIGTAYQAPAPDVDFVTFTQPQGTVQVGENQVTVQCTENLPFPKTTDLNNANGATLPCTQVKTTNMFGNIKVKIKI